MTKAASRPQRKCVARAEIRASKTPRNKQQRGVGKGKPGQNARGHRSIYVSPARHAGYEKLWNDNFKKLVAYKEEHGHCRVPQQNKSLGPWVAKQRMLYRNGKLSKGRIDHLDSIGFERQIQRTVKPIETDAPVNEGTSTENSEGEREEQTDGQEYMPSEDAELSSGHFAAARQPEAEEGEDDDDDDNGEEVESDAESTKEEYKDLCKRLAATCEEKDAKIESQRAKIKTLRFEREDQKADNKLLEMELQKKSALCESAIAELDKSKVRVIERSRPTQARVFIDQNETNWIRDRGYSI